MNTFIEIPATKNSLSNRKALMGVGVNDAPYMVRYTDANGNRLLCPYYTRWADMIKRCYSRKHLDVNPTYIGCSVNNSWLIFSTFKSWMVTQDWHNKSLDKDLIIYGNKTYSPNTCLFVDQTINTLMGNHGRARGIYPQGVTFFKALGKFHSKCQSYGKSNHLGFHDTIEEASNAYKQFKSKHILEVAEEYKNEPRLYEALKNHARIILLTP